MSIVDSAQDLDEARLRLGAEDEAALGRELTYWAIREIDHHHEWSALQEQMRVAGVLHAEAQTWTSLIAMELRKRRDEQRHGGPRLTPDGPR